ncbi:MAG TPA: alpha/beta hydrolase fold domain-containing protein [Nitrososphaeraceae archaeon]
MPSKLIRIIVAAVDYRLAREYSFPTGLTDVISTIRWIANNGQKEYGAWR